MIKYWLKTNWMPSSRRMRVFS